LAIGSFTDPIRIGLPNRAPPPTPDFFLVLAAGVVPSARGRWPVDDGAAAGAVASSVGSDGWMDGWMDGSVHARAATTLPAAVSV